MGTDFSSTVYQVTASWFQVGTGRYGTIAVAGSVLLLLLLRSPAARQCCRMREQQSISLYSLSLPRYVIVSRGGRWRSARQGTYPPRRSNHPLALAVGDGGKIGDARDGRYDVGSWGQGGFRGRSAYGQESAQLDRCDEPQSWVIPLLEGYNTCIDIKENPRPGVIGFPAIRFCIPSRFGYSGVQVGNWSYLDKLRRSTT
ncbi:hypothetical protein KCU88_g452, partial [Aureobasidium melanogenum]